jgi:predicted Zn-dependent protease
VGLGSLYLAGQIGTAVGVDIGGFTIRRFSRREELEADEYGAELLWAAGYDYRGFLKFLQRQGSGTLFEAKQEERQ